MRQTSINNIRAFLLRKESAFDGSEILPIVEILQDLAMVEQAQKEADATDPIDPA